MIEILFILLAGLANRIRGGYGGDAIRKLVPFYGTTIGRLLFSSLLGLGAYVLGLGWLVSLLLVPTLFLGHAMAPFSPFQFMERSNDILILSLRGVILVGSAAVVIAGLTSPLASAILLIGGLLMGPIYKLASVLPTTKLFNDRTVEPTTNETAEVLFGMLLAAALVAISLL